MDIGNIINDSQTLLIAIGIVVVLLLIILIQFPKTKGRVSRIAMRPIRFPEKYEIVDYKSQLKSKSEKRDDFDADFIPKVLGRRRTDYIIWKRDYSYITIRGLLFDQDNKVLEKKEKLYIQAEESAWVKPRDMRVIIDLEEDIKEEAYLLETDFQGRFEFKVKVSYNEEFRSIHQKPLFARLVFSVRTRKGDSKAKVMYEFHFGPELGEMWIGIDPGTTATCIAATNAAADDPEIFMGSVEGKEAISPSRIVFDKKSPQFQKIKEIEEWTDQAYSEAQKKEKLNGHSIDEAKETELWRELFLSRVHEVNREAIDKGLSRPMYETGRLAGSLFGGVNGISFQSIKKLLGYNDIQVVSFGDDVRMKFSGKELASLMVKNFYAEFEHFLRENSTKLARLNESSFNPKRAIVAIPNTFSASQIQDMVDSIKSIKDDRGDSQFAEVKTINEAEAVMVYCMRNHFRDMDEGTVLIFDMGGATINVSLIHQAKIQENFELKVLNRIGYAVGGDSIDWCLAKLLFSFKDHYPELKRINPFLSTESMHEVEKKAQIDLRISLREKVLFPWKKVIVENFKKNKNDLLEGASKQIEDDFIREILGYKQTKLIDEKYANPEESFLEEFYKQFRRNAENEAFPAFETEYFQKYIYNSSYSAVMELLEDNEYELDYVVFSGRSSEFPLIKEKVYHAVYARGYHNVKSIGLPSDEAKTAVARGACIYGWFNTRIKLDSSKIFHSYGVTHSRGISKVDKAYYELLPMGKEFSKWKPEIGNYERGRKKNKEGFDFGGEIGKMIRFYRVSSKKPEEIVGRDDMKHRYTCVGKIKSTQLVNELAIHVDERDIVQCRAKFLDGHKALRQQQFNHEPLTNDHEEHYTWLVQ